MQLSIKNMYFFEQDLLNRDNSKISQYRIKGLIVSILGSRSY